MCLLDERSGRTVLLDSINYVTLFIYSSLSISPASLKRKSSFTRSKRK